MANFTPWKPGGYVNTDVPDATEFNACQDNVMKAPNGEDGSDLPGVIAQGGFVTSHWRDRTRRVPPSGGLVDDAVSITWDMDSESFLDVVIARAAPATLGQISLTLTNYVAGERYLMLVRSDGVDGLIGSYGLSTLTPSFGGGRHHFHDFDSVFGRGFPQRSSSIADAVLYTVRTADLDGVVHFFWSVSFFGEAA